MLCFDARKGRRARVDNLGKGGADSYEGPQAVQMMILLKRMRLRKLRELSRRRLW